MESESFLLMTFISGMSIIQLSFQNFISPLPIIYIIHFFFFKRHLWWGIFLQIIEALSFSWHQTTQFLSNTSVSLCWTINCLWLVTNFKSSFLIVVALPQATRFILCFNIGIFPVIIPVDCSIGIVKLFINIYGRTNNKLTHNEWNIGQVGLS